MRKPGEVVSLLLTCSLILNTVVPLHATAFSRPLSVPKSSLLFTEQALSLEPAFIARKTGVIDAMTRMVNLFFNYIPVTYDSSVFGMNGGSLRRRHRKPMTKRFDPKGNPFLPLKSMGLDPSLRTGPTTLRGQIWDFLNSRRGTYFSVAELIKRFHSTNESLNRILRWFMENPRLYVIRRLRFLEEDGSPSKGTHYYEYGLEESEPSDDKNLAFDDQLIDSDPFLSTHNITMLNYIWGESTQGAVQRFYTSRLHGGNPEREVSAMVVGELLDDYHWLQSTPREYTIEDLFDALKKNHRTHYLETPEFLERGLKWLEMQGMPILHRGDAWRVNGIARKRFFRLDVSSWSLERQHHWKELERDTSGRAIAERLSLMKDSYGWTWKDMGLDEHRVFTWKQKRRPIELTLEKLGNTLGIETAWLSHGMSRGELELLSYTHLRPGAYGNNVRELRIAAGLSVETLSAMTGIDRTALDDIDHGRSFYPRTWPKLAKALGQSTFRLFTGLERNDALQRLPSFSDRLSLLIAALGKTDEEVAQVLGVSAYTVSSYRRGKTRPPPETLQKIYTSLNTTPQELFPDEDVSYLVQKFGAETVQSDVQELKTLLGDKEAAAVIALWADSWKKGDSNWFFTNSADDLIPYAESLMDALEKILGTKKRASRTLLTDVGDHFMQCINLIPFQVDDQIDQATSKKLNDRISRLRTEFENQNPVILNASLFPKAIEALQEATVRLKAVFNYWEKEGKILSADALTRPFLEEISDTINWLLIPESAGDFILAAEMLVEFSLLLEGLWYGKDNNLDVRPLKSRDSEYTQYTVRGESSTGQPLNISLSFRDNSMTPHLFFHFRNSSDSRIAQLRMGMDGTYRQHIHWDFNPEPDYTFWVHRKIVTPAFSENPTNTEVNARAFLNFLRYLEGFLKERHLATQGKS